MSSLARCMTVLAVVLMVGAVSVGCTQKAGEKAKPVTKQAEKKTVDESATDADPGEIDIFADEGDVSARQASEDALGTTEIEEPEIELGNEEITAPTIEEPKVEDIQDM